MSETDLIRLHLVNLNDDVEGAITATDFRTRHDSARAALLSLELIKEHLDKLAWTGADKEDVLKACDEAVAVLKEKGLMANE